MSVALFSNPFLGQSQVDGVGVTHPIATNSPAMVPDIRFDKVPAITASNPIRAMSLRREGAMPPRPPSKMAMELRLANPQRANETMALVLGERQLLHLRRGKVRNSNRPQTH